MLTIIEKRILQDLKLGESILVSTDSVITPELNHLVKTGWVTVEDVETGDFRKPQKRYRLRFQPAKVAWIRNRNIPPGQPGTGRLNCLCEGAPESAYKKGAPDVACQCGRIFNWDGWLLNPPQI